MSEVETLLPPNARPLERAIEQAMAVDAPAMIAAVEQVADPETCSESTLAFHAWARSIEEWDDTWSVERKREVVQSALALHRIKGTVKGVKDMLAAMGFPGAQIAEGIVVFPYDGSVSFNGAENYGDTAAWAEYRVFLKKPITIDQAEQIRAALKVNAPARCRLKGLFFTEAAHRYNAAITYDGNNTHGVVA